MLDYDKRPKTPHLPSHGAMDVPILGVCAITKFCLIQDRGSLSTERINPKNLLVWSTETAHREGSARWHIARQLPLSHLCSSELECSIVLTIRAKKL